MKKYALLLITFALSACNSSDGSLQQAASERTTKITASQPVLRDIDYVLTALGGVESIHRPTISAETGGQIISIDISEGEPVQAGQQLAGIDNTLHNIETARAEAELKRQDVLYKNQAREVARLEQLADSQSVSKDQLEDQQAQLEMLQAQRDGARKQWEQARHMESKTRVLAPQSGMVARRHVSLGDYVGTGTPLFDLVSVSKLRARLAFPEHDAASIGIGKEVRLSSPAAPRSIAIGAVTGINPQINVLNRSVEVTVEFDNPGGWLPGASVDATLVIEKRTAALTLPPTSIVVRNDQEVVFVIEADRAVARPLELGWREVEWVEVLSGLQPGDRVVVEGAALISDGSLLSIVP